MHRKSEGEVIADVTDSLGKSGGNQMKPFLMHSNLSKEILWGPGKYIP